MTGVGGFPDGLPETVPARMVNEFVYCPRLFHLEWVQSRFASNDDVEQGLYVHRVVDQPGGTIPDPDGTHSELLAGRTSRSVWVASGQLKVSAKIDLIEVAEDGSVVPIDYKKGRPDRNGRPWPSDEVQSVLQALVLRDAGYSVSTAEIWYAESRQRVVIPIDDVVATRTRQTVADLWSVAASDVAPPPLVDSPKCPGCSLVGICLPDEINALGTVTVKMAAHEDGESSQATRIPARSTFKSRVCRLRPWWSPRGLQGQEQARQSQAHRRGPVVPAGQRERDPAGHARAPLA